jgi:hypothetical protein
MTSAVLIVPAAALDDANVFCAELGWGPQSFSIPLSSGKGGVTHWAARVDVDEVSRAAIEACPYITPDFDEGGDAASHAAAVFEAAGLVGVIPYPEED